MAFKGTYEMKQGKKYLVNDFCTSEHNLTKSKWVEPSSKNTPINKLLQRMSDEHHLEVLGMNVYLQWNTGSDLDIQVKCGCDKWHGFGTRRFFGRCKCKKCEMKRDHDIKAGEDGRTDAFEHVIFTNPSKLFGKSIGMSVYNYR